MARTGCSHIGAFGGEFPPQIPTIDSAVPTIPSACYDIVVVRRLHAYHLRDELGMMAEIGIHNDNKIASGELD